MDLAGTIIAAAGVVAVYVAGVIHLDRRITRCEERVMVCCRAIAELNRRLDGFTALPPDS